MNPKNSPYERGKVDCCLDSIESCPFSSIGGLDKRDSPTAPEYISKEEHAEYLVGYVQQAKTMYGKDWKTCGFSWKPVMIIDPKED